MLSEIMCRRLFQQQREQDQKEAQLREASIRRRPSWPEGCSGRRAGGGAGRLRGRCPHQPPQRLHPPPHRPRRPGPSLRARGMRAPRNTNQFLMQEKYRLQHMRSDSVGSDGGDLELTDMDSYLGVLENARGALLDPATPPRGPATPPLDQDSMQYFPSEDDLLQSQNFMQRDFVAFCHFLSP